MFRIVDQDGNPVMSDLKTRPYADEILKNKYPNQGYTIQEQPQPSLGLGHTYTQPIERK